MDPKQAEEVAGKIAREIVTRGLAPQDAVRQCYFEYVELIRRTGVRGTFPQLLVARGVVSKEALMPLAASGIQLSMSASGTTPVITASTPAPPTTPSERPGLPTNRLARPPAPTPAARTPPPPTYTPPSVVEAPPLAPTKTDGGLDLLPAEPEKPRPELEPPILAAVAAESGDDDPEFPEVPLEGEMDTHGEPRPGSKLGQWEIGDLLGRGGMAAVYRVRKKGDKKQFAMKVLPADDSKTAARRRARFLREVKAVKSLDHPNIVKIVESGRSGPIDFYVMELIEGEDFEKALQKGKYDLPKRLEIVEGICRAIAHAHENGVIHRDLKPQNVLLDKQSKPKVVDFGLAKMDDEDQSLTRTNTALGTPFYMAPEQHMNAKGIDQRADVFALGVILYEVTADQRPFTGATAAEVGQKVLSWDPPLPSKLKAGVPPAIDAIVAKAIEKDMNRRYPTAGALLDDIKRARQGKALKLAVDSVGVRAGARRWLARNRAAVVGASVAAFVFVPILVFLGLRELGFIGNKVAVVTPPKPTKDPKDPKATEQPKPTEKKPDEKKPDEKKPDEKKPDEKKPEEKKPEEKKPEEKPKPAEKPKTPLEAARADLATPDETADSGAIALRDAWRTSDRGWKLWLAFDRLIHEPLDRGDVAAARAGLDRLAADSGVGVLPQPTRDELTRDLEMAPKLRALVIERLHQDARALGGSVDVPGRERSLRFVKLGDGDLIEVQSQEGGGRAKLDPLALSTKSLAQCLASEPPHVKLALAAFAALRGEDSTKELKAAPQGPYTAHRLSWIEVMNKAREEGMVGVEKDASDEFRAIASQRSGDSKASDDLPKKIEKFATTFGRWDAFRGRKPELLSILQELVPWEKTTGAGLEDGKRNAWETSWTPAEKNALLREFELAPLEPKKPFEADVLPDAIHLANARLAVPLEDRANVSVEARVASPDQEALTLLAGERGLDLDPRSGEATLRTESGSSLKRERVKPLSLAKGSVLAVWRVEEKEKQTDKEKSIGLSARAQPGEGKSENLLKWFFPRGQADKPPTSANRAGVATRGKARLEKLDVAVSKAQGQKRELEARVHEVAMLESRADSLLDEGRPVLLGGRALADALVEGEWLARPDALVATGPATLSTIRDVVDGELSFEVEVAYGPGLSIEVGRSATWLLPASSQPPAPRQVQVAFDVGKGGGAASCRVGPFRLESKLRLSSARGQVKIVIPEGTKATFKNLRVVELSPP